MISLRHKLWIGFGTLLLILLAVSLLTAVVLTRYSHALEQVFRENYDSVTYCDQMKDAIDQLNLRALLLIWNPAPAAQIDAEAEIDKFQAQPRSGIQNITLPGEREHTDHLDDLWRQYQIDLDQFDLAPAAKRAQLYSSIASPRLQTDPRNGPMDRRCEHLQYGLGRRPGEANPR